MSSQIDDTWEVAIIGQNEIRVSTMAGIAVELNRVFYRVSAYYDILPDNFISPNKLRYENDHMNLTRTWVSGDKLSHTHPIKHSAAWEKAYKITQDIAENELKNEHWLFRERRYNSLAHIRDINNQIKNTKQEIKELEQKLYQWQEIHDKTCIEHELKFHEALSE